MPDLDTLAIQQLTPLPRAPAVTFDDFNRTSLAHLIVWLSGVHPEDGADPASRPVRDLAAAALARYIAVSGWHDWAPGFFKTAYGKLMGKTRAVAKACLALYAQTGECPQEFIVQQLAKQGLQSLN